MPTQCVFPSLLIHLLQSLVCEKDTSDKRSIVYFRFRNDRQNYESVLKPCIECSPATPTRSWPKFADASDTLHRALMRERKLVAECFEFLDRIEQRLTLSLLQAAEFGNCVLVVVNLIRRDPPKGLVIATMLSYGSTAFNGLP